MTTDAAFEYRPTHTLAVAAMVFGVMSLLVFVAGRESLEACFMLCPIPLIGLALGLRSLRQIRTNPDTYKGGQFALGAIALSAFSLIGGVALAGYVYATEVPEGYVRTSFEDLRPDEVELRGDVVVPQDIAKLDGQRVFIKGYFRPGSSDFDRNAKRFLLVRDNNQCCFGDISTVKYYDQVAVQLTGKHTVDYSPALYRMGGVLRVFPKNAFNNSGPVYALEADYAIQP